MNQEVIISALAASFAALALVSLVLAIRLNWLEQWVEKSFRRDQRQHRRIRRDRS